MRSKRSNRRNEESAAIRSSEVARPRIAIVTPWYGEDLRGGAERQSWQLAHQLAEHGYVVDVLTTCSAAFTEDWSRNVHRAGVRADGNVAIRRFRVGKRDRRAFDRVNAILLSLRPGELKPGVDPLGESDLRAFYENGINSPDLYAYLASKGARYDRILFLPYLYGTTLFGLPIVRERAYLQPCLHDEAYAYLGRVAEAVHSAKGLLLNSEGEYELALRLFGPGIIGKTTIVGEGVESLAGKGRFAPRIGSFVPTGERYVLYLGRQDPAKGIPRLVRAFNGFKRRHPTSATKLVLAGERPVSYGDKAKDIVDLGPVSESEKAALLEHCIVLMQPSTNESFSRVMYEAWLHGRPVAAHGDCLATATAVRHSGGGYLADTSESWEALLAQLERTPPETLAALGARGRAYARDVAAWPGVIERYDRIFAAETKRFGVPIRQIVAEEAVPRAFAGALGIELAQCGARLYGDAPLNGSAAHAITIRHIGSAGTVGDGAEAREGREILIFHDAPASAPGRATRETVALYASTVSIAERARTDGWDGASLMPFPIETTVWDAPPDPALVAALQDGKHNLLFDGPVLALDHLNDLLVMFLHYLTIEREARLVICASLGCDDVVYARLCEEVERLELTDLVIVARELDEPRRHAIYRTAHAFVSLDPADSPAIGPLRALWFDVPILASKTPTAAALLGDAAISIVDTSDLLAIATLANMLVTDRDLRTKCVRAQRSARARVGTQDVGRRLLELDAERRREHREATEAVR